MIMTKEIKVGYVHKLRVNVKSLAAEAVIIRNETKRAGKDYKDSLYVHRVGRLRTEARYAQLALAYIRGKRYKLCENRVREGNEPSFNKIIAKLGKISYLLNEGKHEVAVKEWLAAS